MASSTPCNSGNSRLVLQRTSHLLTVEPHNSKEDPLHIPPDSPSYRCQSCQFALPPDMASLDVHEQTQAFLEQFVNQTLRILVDDDRIFVGQFKCTDKVCFERNVPHTYADFGEGIEHNTQPHPRIPTAGGPQRTGPTKCQLYSPGAVYEQIRWSRCCSWLLYQAH